MANNDHYILNKESVSKERFYDLLNQLEEIPNTWFCAEQTFIDAEGKEFGGGTTGYTGVDKLGVRYEYQSLSEPQSTTHSLTEVREDTPVP